MPNTIIQPKVFQSGQTVTGGTNTDNLAVTGTSGTGFVEVPRQSAAPTTPASTKDRLYVDTNGLVSRLNANGVVDVLGLAGGQKNFLINGNMQISQRGSSFTGTSTYSLDRWYLAHNYTSASVSQVGLTAGTGYLSALQMTNTTLGTGGFFQAIQAIETLNCLDLLGQTVTFSFLALKSVGLASGQINAFVAFSTSADQSPTTVVNGTIINTLSLTAAALTTSFVRYSLTVSIPSTARTVAVSFNFVGSPTNGQYVQITNTQLNLGSVPAPFQLAGGNAGAEFLLAQRYYEIIGTGVAGGWTNTTQCSLTFRHAVSKRITPVVTLLTTAPVIATGAGAANVTGSGSIISAVGANDVSGWSGNVQGFAGATAGSFANSATTSLFAANAEL